MAPPLSTSPAAMGVLRPSSSTATAATISPGTSAQHAAFHSGLHPGRVPLMAGSLCHSSIAYSKARPDAARLVSAPTASLDMLRAAPTLHVHRDLL